VIPDIDASHGYEPAADAFMASRSRTIGVSTLRGWIASLPPRAAVLDLGCGHGIPITELLVASGCAVFALDASPTLAAAFRSRFPTVPIECATAERSQFFNRTFDAVVSWGLLFLLPPDTQHRLIHKVAAALRADGQFVFTSPAQPCQWSDALTGEPSVSLGSQAYRTLLSAAGLTLDAEADDEGGNHYFFTRRTAADAGAA
jgi:SAM-dependent methyltransferase